MEISQIKRVGYWISEKKKKNLQFDAIISAFRDAGLELIEIDLKKSLEEQGPFCAIMHKIVDIQAKCNQGCAISLLDYNALLNYLEKYPDTLVIDPFENVWKMRERYYQYDLIDKSELCKRGLIISPPYVELTSLDHDENLKRLRTAGVNFPFVCKPSMADGTSLAHKMALIFNEEGVKDMKPPCVAQTFINHNATLHKIFVIGSKYYVVERPSLKNFNSVNFGDAKTIRFVTDEVSKPNSRSELTKLDEDDVCSEKLKPEKCKLDNIVNVITREVGLSLYGIDIIIEKDTGKYAIIDMNPFPSYDGVCDFPRLFTDYFADRLSESGMSASKSTSLYDLAQLKSSFHDSGIDTAESSSDEKNSKGLRTSHKKSFHARAASNTAPSSSS